MDSWISTWEIVFCSILIACSAIGNPLLIYFTKRCIHDKSRIPLILIVNLVIVHLLYNLVVNVLKIVYASGVTLDSNRCKVLVFFTNFTATLAIWFTLYIVLFYSLKLCRLVHPPAEATTTECCKCHLFVVGILWISAFAFYCPFPLHTGKKDEGYMKNESTGSFIYTKCKTEYKNYSVKFFYGRLFLVAIDLLPLIAMLLVGFRIIQLLCEYKKAACGCIWVGHDASETEILRACKFLLLLIPVIISLWTSNFILIRCLKNFKFKYFAPPVLTIVSSGYSAVSPYFLMLINYKLIIKVKCFCYKVESKTVSLSTVSSVDVSPYA
ncbi:uncharacterized protein [Erythrolamprus reginae]|uniref:uncharacterized protein n=1 Tax=Erythrolamprus reginae TaxID=121349 RepID=UPI00396C8BAA